MARAYGTGSIRERNGNYIGRWYVGQQRVERVLGPARKPGTSDGLTKAMAEERMREMRAALKVMPITERLTVAEVGERLIAHKRSLGLKENTTESYESYHRTHIVPRLGDRPVGKLSRQDVKVFIRDCASSGQSAKSIRNYLGLLNGICEYAVIEGWARNNPVKQVDKPKVVQSREIHYLDKEELQRLLTLGTPDTALGRIDRAVYCAAAFSGLRQGELIALRWKDIDQAAQVIRVRQSYSRGRLTTPKSQTSFRSVPMAPEIAAEFLRLHSVSEYQSDDDLVFAHPESGRQLERSRLLKRFKTALRQSGVREIKFHDLRHTFGTQMAAAGIPLGTVQKWMGHDDIKTTMIYVDYMPQVDAARMVSEAMKGVGLSPIPTPDLSETDLNSEKPGSTNTGVEQ